MDDKQWLRWRKIGSSDAPVIMGESPYSTPYQLWERKVNDLPVESNAAMRRGKELEPIALSHFEEQMGVLLKSQECITHPTRYWQTATLDGFDGKILVEIKCPSKEDHNLALKKKVPPKYYAQLQHQLEVTGLDGMYYFSYNGSDGVIVEVERDQKYIDRMNQKEEEFWNCILNFNPPDLCDDDYIDMSKKIGWPEAVNQYKEVCEKIKELEKDEERIRQQLILLSGEKNSHGGGIKLTKSLTKGAIDYSNIPELKDVDLERYRKKSFRKWRISVI